LPDEIDLQRDLDFLTALGLDRDQVDESRAIDDRRH